MVNNKSPKDRDIAMVFQSYALYPHMTVRENMGFALKLAKTPQNVINEKVEEAARILDLTQHLDRRPANLSGGQRQRVAMGRAIVRDPSAFLMDEPLSNLDAKLRVQMRTEVSRLQRRLGTTTVYVTHDQTEAMTLGDRVAVMRSGLLQQVGSPKELYDRPVNLFVAGFIGSPAMNFMGGTLEEGKLRTSLGDFPLSDRLRREVESAGTGREVIVGLRPENFEDAALVSADNRAARDHVPRHHRRAGVAGLRRVRLLHPGARAGGERRRARGAGRGLRARGHRRQRRHHRRPGSTPPPGSARATTPSSGSTPGRCTSSTRPAAGTCRWPSDDDGRGCPPCTSRCQPGRRRGGGPAGGAAATDAGAGEPVSGAGSGRVDGGGYLIFRRSRSMISSFQSWVRMSRYRSAATRM